MSCVLRRFFERSVRPQRMVAVVRGTPYGAEVELADGSVRSFLQSQISEPAIEAAIQWARKKGATTISIRR